MKCFCADLTATQTAMLLGINRNTINTWHGKFRIVIAEFQEEQARQSSGKFELDESYFGGIKKRTHADEKRKRNRGAENKVPVFGVKKRNDGSVYAKIIPNAPGITLFPIIKDIFKKQNPPLIWISSEPMTDLFSMVTNIIVLIILNNI